MYELDYLRLYNLKYDCGMDNINFSCVLMELFHHYLVRLDPKNIRAQTEYITEYYRSALMMIRVPYHLNKVELRPSPYHGRGVFPIRPINPGEVITMYPADLIYVTVCGTRTSDDHAAMTVGSETYRRQFGLPGTFLPEHLDYAFDIDDVYQIVGHPTFDADPDYLGHFINDGGCMTALAGVTTDDHQYVGDSVDVYLKTTLSKRNCRFVVVNRWVVAVVATKPILPHEEVLTTYSVQYWMTKLQTKLQATH